MECHRERRMLEPLNNHIIYSNFSLLTNHHVSQEKVAVWGFQGRHLHLGKSTIAIHQLLRLFDYLVGIPMFNKQTKNIKKHAGGTSPMSLCHHVSSLTHLFPQGFPFLK
jgi:hypothetical protein